MDEMELRTKNLETIQAFLQCRGPERGKTRAPLFAEGAVKEMELPIPGQHVLQQQSAFDWLKESAEFCPIWGFYEAQIYQCADPNLFLVKAVGRGDAALGPNPMEVLIRYYIVEFHMQDGKITLIRETYNPCEIWHL